MKIETITKGKLDELMPDLISLENNWAEIGERPWKKENFEMELPGKWDLSVYISNDEKPLGYAICSIEGDCVKLNKILVDRDNRGKGIATHLWNELLKRSRKKQVRAVEFKVYVLNMAAVSFYKKNGCIFYGIEKGPDERLRYLVKYMFEVQIVVPHSKPTIHESDISAVTASLGKGELASGNIVKSFTKKMSRYIGREYGIATSSGSTALYLALRSLNIKKGDEVIMPSYICGSVLRSVELCGAKAVISDINHEDYNISYEDTKKKVTKDTKAIILPHMFGKSIEDIDDFLALDIPIIEDCALSIGGKHNNKKIGSFGLISVFSFYATKVMTTATGGMVLTRESELSEKIDDLVSHDNRKVWKEHYNARMSDVQASLGISQLARLDEFLERRKEIAKRYNEMFENTGINFKIPKLKENIFYRYIIEHKEKDAIITSALKRGIVCAMPVFVPLHRYLNLSDHEFPNTMNAYNTAISVPIYPSLKDKEISDIAGIIVNWKHEIRNQKIAIEEVLP
jgi:perosamine synthetase